STLPRSIKFEATDGSGAVNNGDTTVIDTAFAATNIPGATSGNATYATSALRLTDSGNQSGTFVVDPPPSVAGSGDFKATFKIKIGGGSTGDGMTFGYGKAGFVSSIAEEGLSQGLSVTFDTFDNGGGEASFGGQTTFTRIELKYDGNVIAVSPALN